MLCFQSTCCDIGIDCPTHLYRRLGLMIRVHEGIEFVRRLNVRIPANIDLANRHAMGLLSDSIPYRTLNHAHARTHGQVVAGYSPNRSDNSRTGKFGLKTPLSTGEGFEFQRSLE